jgi:cardiolipin synthase
VNLNQLPNIITLLRVALLAPLAYYLIHKDYQVALVIFMIAGASDALDGFLAKQFNWTSRFGAIADPLADKMLMLVSYTYLAYVGELPLWLLAIVVGRDVFIVTAAYAFHRRFGPFDMHPSWLSKFNTTFQIFLVTWVMFSLVFTQFPEMVTQLLIVLVTATSLGSGLQYIWLGVKETKMKLKQLDQQHHENKE